MPVNVEILDDSDELFSNEKPHIKGAGTKKLPKSKSSTSIDKKFTPHKKSSTSKLKNGESVKNGSATNKTDIGNGRPRSDSIPGIKIYTIWCSKLGKDQVILYSIFILRI